MEGYPGISRAGRDLLQKSMQSSKAASSYSADDCSNVPQQVSGVDGAVGMLHGRLDQIAKLVSELQERLDKVCSARPVPGDDVAKQCAPAVCPLANTLEGLASEFGHQARRLENLLRDLDL